MSAGEWIGRHLGERSVEYTESEAILYALSVGAPADRLDLVFEDQLRVLPTFGLTVAQWAPNILGSSGAFDNRAVHGSQTLQVHKALPRSGVLDFTARVGNVWDKGAAAIFEVIVECDNFTATWSLFAPGFGDFGGERGPSRAEAVDRGPGQESTLQTFAIQPALYRLTGDMHHIHIDPEAAKRVGAPKPLMHGLCTLAAVTIPMADALGAHPADLTYLTGRFTGHVFPGDELAIQRWEDGAFDVSRDGSVVISDGVAKFGEH